MEGFWEAREQKNSGGTQIRENSREFAAKKITNYEFRGKTHEVAGIKFVKIRVNSRPD